MELKISIVVGAILIFSGKLYAQSIISTDSLKTKELDEVVVTATRSERMMGALPMPVSLIAKMQIKAMGSMRLNDVLTEQTGLVIVPQVNGSGNGIQVQGFNPDYTLILIDGEPLIGRSTGSLDLSRITVGNIKQIEIVKGPSSSLYGSEALAGVINIITERPRSTAGSLYSRYGTNNTLDLSGDASWSKNKFTAYLFANRYSTDGYDLSSESIGPTVSPFRSYTFNSKVTYKFNLKTDLSISGRYFNEEQRFHDEVVNSENELSGASNNGSIKEWNINPVLTHRFSNRFKTVARFYSTQYKTESNINLDVDGSLYYHDDFKQTFTRPELNAEYFINDNNNITVGAGTIREGVQTSRYGDANKRKQQTSYGFFQYEWQPVERANIIIGGRFDHNSVYGSQFSPKLSAQYELNDRITLKASGGLGFKAPDFRQLYLNFNNSSVGYTVLGTEVVVDRLKELEAQGKIQTYLYDSALIGKLEAERSAAVNVGGKVKLTSVVTWDVNGFYNSINNQIESQPVALTNNNQTIYSYRNISRSFTSGVESNFSCNIVKNVTVSAGYQLLYAKDKDVEQAVKKGEVFARDPDTGATRRLKSGDYFGLYSRSRHSGNLKIFYSNPVTKWEGSLRVIYRGKFGVNDINSNAILDRYDDFVAGYALVNLSVAKTITQGIRFQLGVDNLFNYKNATYLPNVPGRLMYASIAYSLFKNDK